MVKTMEEKLVQWTLLKDQQYFSKILNLPLNRCLGTEITTKYGRVDFMFNTHKKGLLVVELETGIDSASKLKHCMEQLQRYIKLKNQFRSRDLEVALVYARDATTEKFQEQLKYFANKTGIILKSYYIQKILTHYNELVNKLNYTSGITLGRSVALGVTSISWLKKFMLPFLLSNKDSNLENFDQLFNNFWQNPVMFINFSPDIFDFDPVDSLPWNKLKDKFTSNTNFYVLKRLVEDFELIEIKNSKKIRQIVLTYNGTRFRDELFLQLRFQIKSNIENPLKEFTPGQKQLLLEILLNGNFTKIKTNIFHFLRFVHITEGNWLPKANTKLSTAECQYLNNLFKSSYNSRTLKDLVIQTCTFCEELGLVKKISADEQLYDNLMFTTLGARAYNYFETLLHVERERYQIPLMVS